MCILATFWSRTYHWIQNNLSSPSILFRFDHLFVTLSNPTPPAHTDGQHRPPPGAGVMEPYPRWMVRTCLWIPEEVLRTFSQFFHRHLNITFMEFWSTEGQHRPGVTHTRLCSGHCYWSTASSAQPGQTFRYVADCFRLIYIYQVYTECIHGLHKG